MSEENHPNIHAAGFTTDLLVSLVKRLRNEGEKNKKEIMSDNEIKDKIVDFVSELSLTIDEIVECKKLEVNSNGKKEEKRK